jgi:hypothetical protein
LGLAVVSSSISASVVSGEFGAARTAPRRPVEPQATTSPGREDAAAAQPEAAADPQHAQSADIAYRAVEAVFDRLRILDWAERVRSDGSGALLIARPDPDGRRPTYPSAVEAYRDIAEVISAL